MFLADVPARANMREASRAERPTAPM
jgi:hypothetical protein